MASFQKMMDENITFANNVWVTTTKNVRNFVFIEFTDIHFCEDLERITILKHM